MESVFAPESLGQHETLLRTKHRWQRRQAAEKQQQSRAMEEELFCMESIAYQQTTRTSIASQDESRHPFCSDVM